MNDNIEERLCGIFTLSGIRNENNVKIKHVTNMNLKTNEHIADTLIEKFDIMKNVRGEIYQCNITDSFLLSSKKLPMSYISVIYEKSLKNILLFRVYLCFTIQSEIKSSKQLLQNKIYGKFDLEIFIENNKKQLDDNITIYPGDEKMFAKFKNFATDEEMKQLAQGLIDDINDKLQKEYEKEFEYYTIPTKILSLKDYYTK